MSRLPPHACRLRVRYHKGGRLAFLGHMEVMGTVMRSVRRSGLPFEVGNGFARRMRIQFSQALPVGASSYAEYFDLLLSEPLDPEAALRSLRLTSPAALAPDAAVMLPRRIEALEAWANLSLWDVELRNVDVDARSFGAAVDGLRRKGTIEFMRGDRPRSLEVAPTLVSCEAFDVPGGVDVRLWTRVTEHGSLRPAVLVDAACGVAPLHVCRRGQWHECEDGGLADPMDPKTVVRHGFCH